MMKTAYYKSPIGILKFTELDQKISSLTFVEKELSSDSSSLIKKTKSQLSEYFSGKRKVFSLPLHIDGTSFQKECWNELSKVPYGELRTYKDIAENINNPKAYRAVGMANNKNKLPIIIPCHRIVAGNPQNGGYAFGKDKKAYLIELENENR